jgi:hypothetical protein
MRNKKNICQGLIAQSHGKTDADRTDLLQSQLFLLLTTGLELFDTSVDEMVSASACGCASEEISQRTTRKGKTVFAVGSKECSELPVGHCGIVDFLIKNAETRKRILDHLQSIPSASLTQELKNGLAFLMAVDQNPESAMDHSPCLKVGDTLIAIESSNTENFYTLNHKESRSLCKALGQTLIIRPHQPQNDDIIEPPG